MNLVGKADKIAPAVQPRNDLKPSPALSLVAKAPKTLKGRTLAVMITESSDPKAVAGLKRAVTNEGAQLKLIAPKIGPMKNGLTPDMTIDGGPSCLFDAVVLLPGQAEMPMLLTPRAINWLRDAFGHLKAIGFNMRRGDVRQGRARRRRAGRCRRQGGDAFIARPRSTRFGSVIPW
jgi:catalase